MQSDRLTVAGITLRTDLDLLLKDELTSGNCPAISWRNPGIGLKTWACKAGIANKTRAIEENKDLRCHPILSAKPPILRGSGEARLSRRLPGSLQGL
jgi:hypothetical protein